MSQSAFSGYSCSWCTEKVPLLSGAQLVGGLLHREPTTAVTPTWTRKTLSFIVDFGERTQQILLWQNPGGTRGFLRIREVARDPEDLITILTLTRQYYRSPGKSCGSRWKV